MYLYNQILYKMGQPRPSIPLVQSILKFSSCHWWYDIKKVFKNCCTKLLLLQLNILIDDVLPNAIFDRKWKLQLTKSLYISKKCVWAYRSKIWKKNPPFFLFTYIQNYCILRNLVFKLENIVGFLWIFFAHLTLFSLGLDTFYHWDIKWQSQGEIWLKQVNWMSIIWLELFFQETKLYLYIQCQFCLF